MRAFDVAVVATVLYQLPCRLDDGCSQHGVGFDNIFVDGKKSYRMSNIHWSSVTIDVCSIFSG